MDIWPKDRVAQPRNWRSDEVGPHRLLETAGETSQDFSVEVFALGGTRVLWGAWNYGGGFNDYGAYATVAPGQSPAKLKDLVAPDLGFYGDYITGAAGDGSTLLYSTIDVGIDRDPDSCADGPCVFRVTGGDVEALRGTRSAWCLA